MKSFKIFSLLFVFICVSCSTVKVTTDYDTATNFKKYKTFAFYKKGIDKAEISDLDKRRILRAIESEMLSKGFNKSENPDVLISIFTKSRKRVDVTTNRTYNSFYWYPMYYGDFNRVRVSKYTEGTLFIDFIDAKEKKLIWQGIGSGSLRTTSVLKKEERIRTFVKEMLMEYPPEIKK